MERVEQTLTDDNVTKKIEKTNRDIASLENKKEKLIDMRLEGIIEKADYELKYLDISAKIEMAKKELADLQEADSTRLSIKKRLDEFRKLLGKNRIIDEFDRAVFESIVDHVIIGGYDENGNKDPEMISFVYKTGFKDVVNGGKFRTPRKIRVIKGVGDNEACSLALTDSEALCSVNSADARGDIGRSFQKTIKRRGNNAVF